MKRKKAILILMIALLSLTLMGCSVAGSESQKESKPKQDYKINMGTDFSNGLAWILGADEEGTNFIGAIDPDGKLAFKMEDTANVQFIETELWTVEGTVEEKEASGQSAQATNFNSNSAFIELGNGERKIVDRSGNTLASIGKSANVRAGGDYFLVKQPPSGYEKKQPQIGVLDKEGKWISELHEMTSDQKAMENKLWSDRKQGQDLTVKEENDIKMEYLGASIFLGPSTKVGQYGDDKSNYMYDAATNTGFLLSLPEDEKKDIKNIFYFNEKIIVMLTRGMFGDESPSWYIYDLKGNVVNKVTVSDEIPLEETNYITFDKENGTFWIYQTSKKDDKTPSQGAIIDINGKVKGRIDQTGLIITNIELVKGGYAGIEISGSDGPYYSIMKEDGGLCFEPKKAYAFKAKYGESSSFSGVFAVENYKENSVFIRTAETEAFDLIDLEGNFKKHITYYNGEKLYDKHFHDGLCYSIPNRNYINKDGDVIIQTNPFGSSK